MSSGNPFRASQLYTHDGSALGPPPSWVDTDSSVPEARRGNSDHVFDGPVSPPPAKTKKQVRIVSPTVSIPPHPDEDDAYGAFRQNSRVDQLYQDPHASLPSPMTAVGTTTPSTLQGSPSAQNSWDGSNMAAIGISSASAPYMGRSQSMVSPGSVPANPFSRTLASLEPQTSETATADGRTATDKPTPGNSKVALDVESFKNLLLTGKTTPRPSAQFSQTTVASNMLCAPLFESGSSTDTSSISRQSLYEPPQETHQETPRTSYEMPESEEDENMGLVSEVRKGKKKPPPAPKHRHGKLVTPRQPQVVSFDSFTATEPAPATVTRSRDSSDMNKPLPPTPVVSPQQQHISTQDSTSSSSPPSPSIQLRSGDPPPTAEPLTVQKRVPPPVPLARRQSQLRSSTTTNRSRSNSSLTMSSQHSIEQVPTPSVNPHDPMASAKSPPPPPPPRHGARLGKISPSSANSSSTELPRRSGSIRTAPPIPTLISTSRRSTIDFDSEPSSPITNVNRTSSLPSNRPAPRTVSGESTVSLPPPPPPPRRRQSNRTSLDQQRPLPSTTSPTESRRTSMEYRRTSLDSKRRTSAASESSLRREYAPVEEKPALGANTSEYALYSPVEESENTLSTGVVERTESGNILDDMEKFQREIDELRNRYKQAG
ncbi:hypothetical protein NX059_003429 [Plenodomus lindquistii]|nr:hypothetical protein NX059_003429 [Plenodomus lindquistii]